nr:hypothetical protein [Tanacetum cinerariifolium]
HWQWQNSSSSGNYFALPEGTSSGSGNFLLAVGTSSGSGNTSLEYIGYQTRDIVRTILSVEMKMLQDLKKMTSLEVEEASR